MKKQSDLSRLMGYAGNYRYFTYASWVLSAASALVALVPFVYIWKILRDVLNAAPDYAQAVNIPHYGWMAVLFAVLSYLIYIAALMCSHLSAFRVATNLRLAVSEHLAVLPLGFAETFGSGKLHVTVGYIPTASADDSIINPSSDTPTKYMDYLFERQSGSWYLTGLTESETKPESAASSAAAQPEPMAESDVQDAILATAGDSAAADSTAASAVQPEAQAEAGADSAVAESPAAENAASTAA